MFLQIFSKISKWYVVSLFFLGSFSFQFLLVESYLPRFLVYSSGIKNPDQMFWYSKKWLSHLYDTLGDEGRSFYVQMLSMDFVYIIFTALAFSGLMYILSRRTRIWWISFAPALAASFDILENSAQLVLLNNFPELSSLLVTTSSVASFMKMSLMAFIMVAIIILISRILYFKISANISIYMQWMGGKE